MNPRKPIYAMMAGGLVVVLALTFIPYALVANAGRIISANVIVGARVEDEARDSSSVGREAPPAPQFDVAGWYAERGEDLAKHGVLVETLDGRRTLGQLNAEQPFNPASLVKLATSLAALRKLGVDYRFETRVFVDGEIDGNGDLRGRLIVSGNDPTFGDYAAALIAEELRVKGIRRIDGDLVVSESFSFNFSESPEESAKRLARVAKLSPRNFLVDVAPNARPLFTVRSNSLREILLYMNAHSSNFVAERLGAEVGGPEGLRAFLIDELKLSPERVAIETASGLGHNRLTPRDILTIIRALDGEAVRQGASIKDFMPVASGDYGTLRRRFIKTPLEGVLVGKTGTLVHDDGGMASLGGVVFTKRYGAVLFVALSRGSSVALNRQTTDELLTEMILSSDEPVGVELPVTPRRQLERNGISVSE